MFERLNPFTFLLGAAVVATAGFLLYRSQFSPDARLRRRRRRNYGPTVSKAKGPAVKLAVNAEESKE